MHKLYIIAFSIAFAALPSLMYATTSPVTLRVAVHVCSPGIQSADDLHALGGFEEMLEACPAADARSRSGSVYSVRTKDGAAGPQASSAELVCGSARSHCPAVRYEEYPGLEGPVTFTEIVPPPGSEPGTIEFVPSEWDGNDDSGSLVSYAAGIVHLSTDRDKDGVIALHVFDFSSAGDEMKEERIAFANGGDAPGIDLAVSSDPTVASDEDEAETMRDRILDDMRDIIHSMAHRFETIF